MTNKPLSKEFYSFITFFSTVLVITSVIQGVAFLRIGSKIVTLNAFAPWIWLIIILLIIANAAMVRYLVHHGYRTAAVACVASCIPMFFQYAGLLNADLRAIYQAHFHVLAYALFGTTLLWGLSLAFSKTGEKKWLRLSGILTVVFTVVLAAVYYSYFHTQSVATKLLLDQANRWISMAAVISVVPLLIHFRAEGKRVADNSPAQTGPALLKLAALGGVFVLGFNFSVEATGRAQPYKPSELELRRAKRFEAYYFTDGSGDTLRYRMLEPLDYDSTQKYPLVVCLHHGGSHGSDNIQQLSADPAPFLMEMGNRKKYPSFIFMPQSPEGMGFSGAYGSPSVDSLVFGTIRQLQATLPIDSKRIYVMGISGGGYGSWHLISAHPELFAAAIPICGGGDPRYAPKLIDVPVWAFHGARDNLAPVAHSRDMVNAMRKAGGKPKYTEYEFAGHGIWDKVREEGIMEWMFAQHRD